jgi:hypothetical protein
VYGRLLIHTSQSVDNGQMLTFARDPYHFGKSINCTQQPTNCDMSRFISPGSKRFQVIHYSGAPCRKRLANKNYAPASFVSVLDAKRIPIDILNSCVAPRFCTDLGQMTQASCALKHMIAWLASARAKQNVSIIVEDDILPMPGFHTSLTSTIAALPVGWDIFNFGCSKSTRPTPGPHFCSRGYALSKRGAEKMLMYRKVVDTCDGMVLRASRQLNAYHMKLPTIHGSYIGNNAMPRGADLCNRSINTLESNVLKARAYYARANSYFRSGHL